MTSVPGSSCAGFRRNPEDHEQPDHGLATLREHRSVTRLPGLATFAPALQAITLVIELTEPERIAMRISDLLRSKGTAVATVEPQTTVKALLSGLAEHNVGAMVVIGPEGIAGIVSERDVVRRLNDHGTDLLDKPVSEIMTKMVASCVPEDSVDDLSRLMTERRIRHVPVLVDGKLAGIISIGDVVKNRMQELEKSQEQLEAYISQG
jgi:CBS domain-containing protein